jgi:hypothetical protein
MSAGVPVPSFFPHLLSDSKGRELKVSAAFAACFHHSTVFREATLALFSRLCRVRVSGRSGWSCESEVDQSVGRIDLQLASLATKRRRPVTFWIESKVQAVLTKAQLRRYRRISEDCFLIALTKHPPETGSQWLRDQGIFALRWQDVHRVLKGTQARGADRFLIAAFVEYLEVLGMAHREDLRLADLQRLNTLFGKISASENTQMAVGTAFEVASSCLGVADDVLQAAWESHGKQLVKLQRFGPSYFKWFDEGVPAHFLGFRFHDYGWSHWLGAAFVFPANGNEAYWEVGGKRGGQEEFARRFRLKALTRSDDVLDVHKLTNRFLSVSKRFGTLK